MEHLIVKFIDKQQGEYRAGDWHLVTSLPDGSKTACGVEYERVRTSLKITSERFSGGVTCPNCIAVVNHFKSIRL